jgi:hypothetical protein
MRSRMTLTISVRVFLIALTLSGCHRAKAKQETPEQQQERMLASLQQKAIADLESHKSQEAIWHVRGDEYAQGSWFKEKYELPDSYSYNVLKMDSPGSPYLGMAEFPVTGQISYPFDSQDGAQNAIQFPNSNSTKHRLVYAFENGQWIFKSELCFRHDFEAESDAWGNCYGAGDQAPVMKSP